MDKQAAKDILYGGLLELARNKKYYYQSAIGPQYCKWTEEGAVAVKNYMDVIVPMLCQIDEVELNQRAKDLVVKGLKGEQV